MNREEELKPDIVIIKGLITKHNNWLSENRNAGERRDRLYMRRMLQEVRREQKEELRGLRRIRK